MNTFYKTYSRNGKTLSSMSLFVDSCNCQNEKVWLVTIINSCGEVMSTLKLPGSFTENDIYALFCAPEISYAASERNENEHYLVIPKIGQQIQSIRFDFFKEEPQQTINDVPSFVGGGIREIGGEENTNEIPESIEGTVVEETDRMRDFIGVETGDSESVSVDACVDVESDTNSNQCESEINEESIEAEEVEASDIDLERGYRPIDDYSIEMMISSVFKVDKRRIESYTNAVKSVFDLINSTKKNTFVSKEWLKKYMDKVEPNATYNLAKARARGFLSMLAERGLVEKKQDGPHSFIYTVKKEFIETFSDEQ